ncbi:MAG: putative zinc-binding protein [Bacillota bacterium]
MKNVSVPIIYSCSGCSSAAQMANHLAVSLDRRGLARMSCIAGVGGDVPALVKVAKSGRAIVALDGCPLACVKSCLARHDVQPALHVDLSTYGVAKRLRADFDRAEAARVEALLIDRLVRTGLCSQSAPDGPPIGTGGA